MQEEHQRLENDLLKEQITSLQINNRKREELEQAANSLSRAARELEIRPIQKKIIDISEVLSDIKSNTEEPLE